MKLLSRLILSSCVSIGLVSCDTGFELDEESSTDTIYSGPIQSSSWRLLLNEDGESFRMQKRASANAEDNEYAMSGTYASLATGFSEFTINSGRNSEVTSSTLPAIQIGDDSFVFFPFIDSSNELLALIPTDTCPGSDIRGNSLFLDRDSDTSNSENFWLSSFQYDVSQNQAEYSDAIALDDNFSLLGDALDQNGGACSEGTAEATNGDHYLSTRSAVIEARGSFTDDDYARTFNTRSRTISDILDFDSDGYVGFIHYQGALEESYYVSAGCSSGFCSIFREEDYDQLDMDNFVYEIEINQNELNYQFNGAAIGVMLDEAENQGNIACTFNSSLGGSSTKLVMCNAQSPTENDRLVTIILIDPSS